MQRKCFNVEEIIIDKSVDLNTLKNHANVELNLYV